jgi:hypothetical protein
MGLCDEYNPNKKPSESFLNYIKKYIKQNVNWDTLNLADKKKYIKEYETYNEQLRFNEDCWHVFEKDELLKSEGININDVKFKQWLKLEGIKLKHIKDDTNGHLSNIIKAYKDETDVTKNNIGSYTELQFKNRRNGGKRKRKTLKRSKKTKRSRKSRKSKRKMTKRRRR